MCEMCCLYPVSKHGERAWEGVWMSVIFFGHGWQGPHQTCELQKLFKLPSQGRPDLTVCFGGTILQQSCAGSGGKGGTGKPSLA